MSDAPESERENSATLSDDAPLELGDVVFLKVTDVNHFGAFVDWGLPKELLVPFSEQTRDLQVGDREPIGVQQDGTQRFFGTMKIRELLHTDGDFKLNEWVRGVAWRKEPEIGLFVIVERRFLALLPAHEPHALARGEAARFRVAHVLRDGKIELSLRAFAHEQLKDDAQLVLAQLKAHSSLRVSDHSDPSQIRAEFGLSKKAFKRAVGRLLKEGAVQLAADGVIVPR